MDNSQYRSMKEAYISEMKDMKRTTTDKGYMRQYINDSLDMYMRDFEQMALLPGKITQKQYDLYHLWMQNIACSLHHTQQLKSRIMRRRTFKTLKAIIKASGNHQITAQEILNENLYLNKTGWTKVKITPELREQIAVIVSQIFGGHHVTRIAVEYALINSRPQHWGLTRVLVNDKHFGLSYCAGQDYTYECNEIRTYLKNQ